MVMNKEILEEATLWSKSDSTNLASIAESLKILAASVPRRKKSEEPPDDYVPKMTMEHMSLEKIYEQEQQERRMSAADKIKEAESRGNVPYYEEEILEELEIESML